MFLILWVIFRVNKIVFEEFIVLKEGCNMIFFLVGDHCIRGTGCDSRVIIDWVHTRWEEWAWLDLFELDIEVEFHANVKK